MALELLLVKESGAVDAAEHGALFIAAPIGPGHAGELEGSQTAGGGQVRPPAQVGEVALAVDAHLVGVQAVDKLNLEHFALVGEVLERLVPAPGLTLEWSVLLNDFAHFVFDGRQVLRGEGPLVVEIVVKAVFYGRADGHLDAREELFDRLGHDVGGGVAQHLQGLGLSRQHRSKLGLGVHQSGQVQQLSVIPSGNSFPGRLGVLVGQDLSGSVLFLHSWVHLRRQNKQIPLSLTQAPPAGDCRLGGNPSSRAGLVGTPGFEPGTSTVSGWRSPPELRA